MYNIVLLPEAKKSYKKLCFSDKAIFERINNALDALKSNPFLGKPLKDNLKGKYSLRIGVYRIIYFVEKHKVIIYILDIGHRREVYRVK
ncbi:MAG: type II toxin-antitoxin system RelE/ParE family toxin [Candidatus Omnitrophota bacterium]